MALNGLICADMPLRTYTLTHLTNSSVVIGELHLSQPMQLKSIRLQVYIPGGEKNVLNFV